MPMQFILLAKDDTLRKLFTNTAWGEATRLVEYVTGSAAQDVKIDSLLREMYHITRLLYQGDGGIA